MAAASAVKESLFTVDGLPFFFAQTDGKFILQGAPQGSHFRPPLLILLTVGVIIGNKTKKKKDFPRSSICTRLTRGEKCDLFLPSETRQQRGSETIKVDNE